MTAQSLIQEYAEYGVGQFGTALDTHIAMFGKPSRSPRRVLIALHGRQLTSITWGPITSPTAYEHIRALIQRGYAVVAVDAAGLAPWSNAASMAAIDAAVSIALARFGGSQVGVAGFSMGGLEALNYIKRYPARVNGSMLWSPCTDMRWAYAPSGYTPAYGGGVSPLTSTFHAEIDTAYDCTSATFVAATNGYRVVDEYATWRGLSPIKVVHADDDVTVPVAQSQAFVAGVNSPSVTLTEVTTGGHGPWTSTDPAATAAFFDSLDWG